MRWRIPMDQYDSYGYGFLQYVPAQRVYHPGLDIGKPANTDLNEPIYNCADGIVEWAGNSTGWGNHVLVRHTLPGGQQVITHHAHMNKLQVKTGDTVVFGQVLGLCGSTGNSTAAHDHWEIRRPGLGITFYPVDQTEAWVAARYYSPLQFVRDNDVPEPVQPPQGGDDMTDDEKRALTLLNSAQAEFGYGNLEGTANGLIGALRDLKTVQEDLNGARTQIASLQGDVVKLKERLAQQDQEDADYASQLMAAQKEIEQLKRSNDELTEELHKESQAYEEKIVGLLDKIVKLEDKLNQQPNPPSQGSWLKRFIEAVRRWFTK